MQLSLVYIFIHIYGVKTTHWSTSIDSKVIHSRLSFNVNCNLDIRSCHVGYFQLNVRAAKGCRLCSQSSTLQCCALCCPIMNDNFHLTCTNLQKGAPGNRAVANFKPCVRLLQCLMYCHHTLTQPCETFVQFNLCIAILLYIPNFPCL